MELNIILLVASIGRNFSCYGIYVAVGKEALLKISHLPVLTK